MCIKTNKLSSSSPSFTTQQKPKALNPSAQEWRPNQNTTKQPHPYHLLPRVSFAPPPLYRTPLSFPIYQGFSFTLSGSCTPAHHPVYDHSTVDFPPPETPIPGCGPELNGPKAIPVSTGKGKFTPPRFRRAMSSFSSEKKPTTRSRRLEWKPRNTAAAAASSPPRACPKNPPSVAEELSPHLKTTVMIKNIPNYLRRDFMLEFMDSYCRAYKLEYDFMYLPMDFRRLDNLGYAFVNFTCPGAAQKFKNVLQNYKWNTFQTRSGKLLSSRKVCEITWARIQGKEGLVKRFENSTFACDKPGFLPVVLDPPRNGSDPDPAPPTVVGRAGRVPAKAHSVTNE